MIGDLRALQFVFKLFFSTDTNSVIPSEQYSEFPVRLFFNEVNENIPFDP